MPKKPYLILVATYNEIGNVPRLIPLLQQKHGSVADILVIDDESPDGTSDWVENYSKTNPDVTLIRRRGARGRGHASKLGYQYFLEHGYPYLIEIDADLSHNPEDIQRLMDVQNSADMIIGSRYVDGGGFGNYKWYRVILSRTYNFVLRTLLGITVRDGSQSFQLIHRRVFEKVDPSELESPHFSIFLELKALATRAKFRLREIPINIKDRTEGESKLYLPEQLRSILKMVFALRIRRPMKRMLKSLSMKSVASGKGD